MIPRNDDSAPIGIWIAAALAPKRFPIEATLISKSAPVASILFENTIRGTRYSVAWRQTVSVCGSTPALESNTVTAPSNTRKERSTSAVKSTWPGVSIMLIWQSCQWQVVAAEVIVIPRSCS